MNRESERENPSEERGQSSIRQFFQGRSVFITGATGFVGKILVEKLLRCCPEIENMYLLMRPKKGMNPEERMKKLLNSELFSILKEKYPSFEKKIVLVDGDIDNPQLGLCDEDLNTIQTRVSVIFHSAARVRYDDHLRTAAHHHLTATKRLLELCKNMPELVSLIYVSTAYVHREPDFTVPEKVVPCKIMPEQLLQALEWMDDGTVDQINPSLLREKFNNYFLTKALTENIILENRGDMPVGIVRPCIIGSTWKDPIPGWCDTIQGPSGLLLAAAKGFLRTLYSIPGLQIAVIPADVVVNTMIASAWFVGTQRPQEILVVNCVHDDDKLLDAYSMMQVALDKREEYPLWNMYRYPDFTLYYSRTMYKIHSFWDQYVPAFIIDIFLYLFTGKAFMLKLYKRIESIFEVFVIVAQKPWIMKNENLHLVQKSMCDKDKEEFFMDMSHLNWATYLDICMRGGRKFLAHEEPTNIRSAKRKAAIWWFVTTVLKWIIILGLVYYVFCKFFQH